MLPSAAYGGPSDSLTPNARRPDEGGIAGEPVMVRSNFFAISKVDVIWHYHVSITPELPREKARKLWKVIEATFPELPKNKTVFDGTANAYAAQELKVKNLMRKVELPDEGSAPRGASASAGPSTNISRSTSASSSQAGPLTKGGPGGKGGKDQGYTSGAPAPSDVKNRNEFTVRLEFAAKIDLSELHRFLRAEGPITPGCLTAIQALNIAMSHKLFSNMVSFGRSAFLPNNPQDLGGGIEKWDGVFQSVRPGQGKLYANIDVASTAFVKGGNAAELISEVLNVNPQVLHTRQVGPRDCMDLQRHFKGSSFTVTHRGGDFKRKFRVCEISKNSASNVFFNQETNGGQKVKVSISDYYKSAYNITLQYPNLPCIGVQKREGIMYFPPEVCNIASGTRYMRKLSDIQTANMIKGTCQKPFARQKTIMNQLLPVLDFDRNEYLKGFKMEVSKRMTEVPSRVLTAPKVLYSTERVTPDNGGWQMKPSRKMVEGMDLRNWGVLVYDRENKLPRSVVESFIRMLSGTLSENGMIVSQPKPMVRYAQLGGDIRKQVGEFMSGNTVPQLILVLMPMKCPTYAAVKAYCELHHQKGVLTQCALTKHVYKPSKQYCGNLGLKINAKLGGVNNNIEPQSIPFLTSLPTMIIGADVTHPSPGDTRKSVAAVVGSMDNKSFRYAGRIMSQDSRVEVIERLEDLVHELLIAFQAKNRVLPRRILFYRDGVSEGQYAQVIAEEIEAVRLACKRMQYPTPPKITFIVVKKRHHARFFPIDPRYTDRSGNCVAGTVVDSVITHPTEFDFYLQSHGGLQGTSRPTLYHILVDENQFSSDDLQELTYRLCYVYARCTKAVSIVPAVYYAHLLAFRARHYQSDMPPDRDFEMNTARDMKNVMYFV